MVTYQSLMKSDAWIHTYFRLEDLHRNINIEFICLLEKIKTVDTFLKLKTDNFRFMISSDTGY